jgi:hypothetical protein
MCVCVRACVCVCVCCHRHGFNQSRPLPVTQAHSHAGLNKECVSNHRMQRGCYLVCVAAFTNLVRVQKFALQTMEHMNYRHSDTGHCSRTTNYTNTHKYTQIHTNKTKHIHTKTNTHTHTHTQREAKRKATRRVGRKMCTRVLRAA